jgi:flagellar biosynthetic protein FliQ
MVTTDTLSILNQAIAMAIKLAAPLLLASLGIGLLIAILQAATQVNEQTMTFVPKLFLIALVLLAMGPWMLTNLSEFFMRVFALMVQ